MPSTRIKSQTQLCVPVTPSLKDGCRQIWTAHRLASLSEMVASGSVKNSELSYEEQK